MIKKYKQYNESIKSLLVGPTKEEVWKNLGYGRTFDTPEEFIEYIGNNLEKIVIHNTFSDTIYWKFKPQDEVYFEYNTASLFYSEERIYNILNGIFNMESNDINLFFKKHLNNKLNIQINSTLRQKKFFWRDI